MIIFDCHLIPCRARGGRKNAFPSWIRRACLVPLLLTGLALTSEARTRNGNDFALYYSEAATEAERKELLKEAGRQLYFFRYLQIMEMEEKKDELGRACVAITAFEPSSLMDVAFKVTQPVSLSILREEPASRPGDAIAVTGRIVDINPKTNTLTLDPVIVRHKDKLSPAAGVEMLYDVQPGGTFYSFTDGSRPISLSYRDRDLLQHRKKILKEQGAQAWLEFLERELAVRKEARARQERSKE